MAQGLSNSAIAARVFLTERGVEKHVTSIFQKLRLPVAADTHRRVLAVVAFLRHDQGAVDGPVWTASTGQSRKPPLRDGRRVPRWVQRREHSSERHVMHPPAAPVNGVQLHRLRPVPLALLALVAGVVALVLALSPGTGLDVFSGVHGSGVGAVQTRILPSFTSLDLTGSSTVNVHVGRPQSVVVHADDNLIELVKTDVRDGQLVIAENGHFSSTRSLVVEVTVPRLSRATLSGSGMVDVAGVRRRASSPS